MMSIAWPRNADGSLFTDKIRLDKTSVLDYLDDPEALPLRYSVADIIAKHNCKSVVDVGCGVGRINDFINVEHYMGFDDDIKLVGKGFRKYKNTGRNIDLRHASWRNHDKIGVEFKVDCLLMLGVLSYAMPEFEEVYEKNGHHKNMFHDLIDFYNPRVIIVQEILADQTNVVDTNELKVLPLEYYLQFEPECVEFDLPIWCGHRVIMTFDNNKIRKITNMNTYEKLVSAIRDNKMVADTLEITPSSSLEHDIGFDSLDAVELIMVIDESFGVQFTTLFQYETIQGLADAIDERLE